MAITFTIDYTFFNLPALSSDCTPSVQFLFTLILLYMQPGLVWVYLSSHTFAALENIPSFFAYDRFLIHALSSGRVILALDIFPFLPFLLFVLHLTHPHLPTVSQEIGPMVYPKMIGSAKSLKRLKGPS